MRWSSRAAALLALALTPVAASAQALSCAVPDRIPVPRAERPPRGEGARVVPTAGYLLALSWSPQYCASRRGNSPSDAFQCRDNRFGWVLHGLWPEGATAAYPQWCRPARIVPRDVLRRNLCMTPSVQLLQHEWTKHGTCMSPNPAAYFNAARILFQSVRFPDMARLSGQEQSAGDIRRAFARANPDTVAPMWSVSTDRGGWLKEVRLCLGPRMRPQRCTAFQRGAPDTARVRITPPR